MAQHCILIVEPELPIRHPVAEYLRECGYRVLEAVDVEEAKKLMAANAGLVDIVLVDVATAGGKDSFGLSHWIKSNGDKAKVLLSGTVEKVAEDAGTLCEQGPKLAKPYHHQQLHEEIKKLLAAHARANDLD